MKTTLLIFIKGMFMGVADLIPGISGGTIAVITGIYQDFIQTLSQLVNQQGLTLLKNFRIKDYFTHINGPFIIPLAGGIFFSIIALSRVITYINREFPIMLWSFFFGLIFASAFLLLRQTERLGFKTILLFIIGTLIAYATVSLPNSPPSNEINYLVIFGSGLVALSAMMLPGISGSFLLVIMGQYPIILKAISEFNLPIIITFAIGGAISLIFFSKFINYLMEYHHQAAISLLAGFLLGSLKKVWPWKIIENDFEVAALPDAYSKNTLMPAHLELGLTFFVLAIILIVAIDWWGNKKKEIKGTIIKGK